MTDLPDHPIVKPEVIFVDDLLKEVAKGRVRVPSFQRPYVWRPAQMRSLFDSIERGYPIGALLLWETDLPVSSLDAMGTLSIPTAEGGTRALVLDGHQRLATLYSVLRLSRDHARDAEDESWRWWIYRDLRSDAGEAVGDGVFEGRYAHVRRGEVPNHYLPLRSVLKTRDFLDAARQFDDEELVEEADRVANRLKSYKLSLIRVIGGTLAQAVEIFSRLNSEGQRMKPDQMVSALTYREDDQVTFNLSERVDETLEEMTTSGFGGIPRDAVFRTMLVAAGEDDIQRANWSRLARRVGSRLAHEVDHSQRALRRGLRFLKEGLLVCHGRLLPYAAQLVLIATYHLEREEKRTTRASRLLQEWFWSTSFSGWFAGANSTQIKDCVVAMRKFARTKKPGQSLLGGGEPAMPYPTQFDMRSARVRTLLLAQLHTQTPLGLNGEPINVAAELALNGARAYRHIFSTQLRGTSYHGDPCNRILLPAREGSSIRQTLIDLDPMEEEDQDILRSHFITAEAHKALGDGDYETMADLRRIELIAAERAFIEKWGLSPPDAESGPSEIDTAEWETEAEDL